MSGGVLSGREIQELVLSETRLVADYMDLDSQVQPNGFDLTLEEVRRFTGRGSIAISNDERELPDLEAIAPDDGGYLELPPGPFHITYRETVNIPKDLMAFGRPRSSLTRSGVSIHTAVWDAGYSGRSTSLMVVNNSLGFRVQIGARVAQLVFIRLSEATAEGYSGIFQGENIKR